MGFLSGGLIKAIIIAVAVAAVTAFIGGGYMYIKAKDDKIVAQEETIGKLNTEITKLQVTKATLEGIIKVKDEQIKNAIAQAEQAAKAEQAASERVIEFQRRIEDKERQRRIQNIRESKKASLLLRMMNNATKCELENFGRRGGECRGSRWVETIDE